jgi:hypothetical protein
MRKPQSGAQSRFWSVRTAQGEWPAYRHTTEAASRHISQNPSPYDANVTGVPFEIVDDDRRRILPKVGR